MRRLKPIHLSVILLGIAWLLIFYQFAASGTGPVVPRVGIAESRAHE